MRFFKSIFASLVLTAFVFSVQAASSTDPNAKDVRVEIKDMIKKLDLANYIREEKVIKINFMLNTNNEIIVLSTSDKSLDSILKSNLNYKRINSGELEQNKVYSIPVRLIK